MIKEIAISQVIDRIRFENSWWATNQIDPYFRAMPKRAYSEQFFEIASNLNIHRSVVLLGPRRIGKTVMLYHLIQELIDSGHPARKILFITVENPIYNNVSLDQLFKYGMAAAGVSGEIKGWYVIFDEIQYLKNWDIELKSLTDSYRDNRFIVSGSAAVALKLKSTESGAGRFTDFMLPPLTFYEFIQMQNLSHLVNQTDLPWANGDFKFYTSHDIREFNRLFLNYINYGGYPEALFSEAVRNNPERFIRNDVVDKVLLRDLPGLYGISNVQELNSLFTTIAYNTACEFSLETLSRQSGSPKNTIKKYLEYLESAFLIKIVKRVDQSGKRFQRENFFKIYLTNSSLRSALFSPIGATDENIGNMAETAIYSQWLHKSNFTPFYARWSNGEVDMIKLNEKNLHPKWALEIKWTDRYIKRPEALKSLIKFCKENNLKQALVTSINIQDVKEINGLELSFIPAASYAYTVGADTMLKP
ncbi:MAG: ATP-binding protein [Bacteroidales bacterium]|jgi:predicted AAA+ superfamily ATPase|nr:ATP-binding protein [Bacteroidales bacterium]NLB86335.1 ATP-binding protein [Bacteroidales bacterium]